MTETKRGLSAAALKRIALVTMLIDHIGAALLETMIFLPQFYEVRFTLYTIDRVLRTIGRAAFPLYIFLLVEGFMHTRSRARYLARLSLFALISEIPFDLAFNAGWSFLATGTVCELSSQNVFWTLAIGFACLCLIEKILPPAAAGKDAATVLRLAGCLAVLAAGAVLAQLLRTDYSWGGVAAIGAAYLMKRIRQERFEIPAMLVPLVILSSLEIAALVDWPLTTCYNGQKGRQKRWLYYLFYPGHLLLLGLVKGLWFR